MPPGKCGKLPTQGSATLLPSEVLPTPGGRPGKESAFQLLLELDDSEKFQETVLDLVQSKMLFIQETPAAAKSSLSR